MPLDPAAEALLNELLDLYRAAQANLIDQLVAEAATPGTSSATYRQRLDALGREIDAALVDLDRAAHGWARDRLPEIYQLGADKAGGDIGERFAWTQIHREAVQVLAGDTYQDLLAATRYVRRDSKTFIREAARARSASVLLEGVTATRAGRALAGELEEVGIAAVTYKNGARHSLGDYSDTVLRTKTAAAHNAGTLNMGREHGVQWVRIADGPTCGWSRHDDGDTANGSVRSLADAEAHPISHPRCGRAFSLIPARTKAEAERLARGDFTDLPGGAPPPQRPPSRRGGHQQRLEGRQKRIETRAKKVAGRGQVGVQARTALSEIPGPRSAVGRGATHAFDQIEKVHRIPAGMQQVPLKTASSSANYYGVYEFDRAGRARTIRVRASGDHISGTTAHEFGHFLDHQGNLVDQVERVGAPSVGRFERAGGPAAPRGVFGTSPVGREHELMQAFDEAVDATPTMRRLRQEAETSRSPYPRYLVQRNEIWARSYHQWIATRSGDPAMLAELRLIRSKGGDVALSQWSDDEFGPIADALDEIFRAKGLL